MLFRSDDVVGLAKAAPKQEEPAENNVTADKTDKTAAEPEKTEE